MKFKCLSPAQTSPTLAPKNPFASFLLPIHMTPDSAGFKVSVSTVGMLPTGQNASSELEGEFLSPGFFGSRAKKVITTLAGAADPNYQWETMGQGGVWSISEYF